MATTITRRPLPALVALLALLALTALVWWRVIDRDNGSGSKAGPKPVAPTCVTAPAAAPGTAALGTPGSVTVRVLNSTSRPGIAAKARTQLLAAGFKIPDPAGNDAPSVSIKNTAQIRYGTAGAGGARLLLLYFPGATLVHVEKSTSAVVTVSLGDAYTGVATSQQVRAALASSGGTSRSTASPQSPPPSPQSPTPAATGSRGTAGSAGRAC